MKKYIFISLISIGVFAIIFGGFNISKAQETPKSLTLTSPNGGEVWILGKPCDIIWQSEGISKAYIWITAVDVNGKEVPTFGLGLVAYVDSVNGANKWTWSDCQTGYHGIAWMQPGYYKVKIQNASNNDSNDPLYDWSDSFFSVGLQKPSAVYPLNNSTVNTLTPTLEWSSVPGATEYWYRLFETANGSTLLIENKTTSTKFAVPSGKLQDGKRYRWRVGAYGTSPDGRQYSAWASGWEFDVKLSPKSLTLTSPNGGEKWKTGETYNITWNSSGVEKVKIYLGNFDSGIECVNVCGVPSGYGEVCCDPCGYQLIATDVSASPSKYSWTIPSTQAAVSKAKIAIQSTATNGCPLDYGDNYFSIAAATPINCGWCGRDCVNLTSDMAYIALAPPIGYKCLEENGKCVKKEEEIMKKVKEILIKLPDKPEVYRIVHGKRVHIPTIAAFNDLKLDWKDVVEVSSAEIVKYPLANLIKLSDDPKVYVVGKGLVRHVPNPEVFNSYNFSWGDIITVSPTELKEYGQANLIRGIGEAKVYLVENGKKRWVETAEIFTKKSYDWLKIVEINEIELKAYPTGSNIK